MSTGATGAKSGGLSIIVIGLATMLLSGCGWVVSFETATFALAERIGFDQFGRVQLSGVLQDTMDADPGEDEVIITGPPLFSELANFGITLDGRGNYLSSGVTDPPRAEQVRSVDGSYYRYGVITGTVDIDPGPGVTEVTAGDGFGDLFIARFDPFGRVLWANVIEAGGFNAAWGDVKVDANGDLLVVGDLNGIVDVDPGPAFEWLSSSGRSDGWAAKYNFEGELIWATSLGGADLDRVLGFDVTPQGNVVVAGEFFGTADFGPGPGSASFTSAGSTDGFVVTLDGTNGEVVTAGALSSTGFLSMAEDPIVAGADGSVTVVGSVIGGSVDLDPGPGVAQQNGGIFVVRLNADGTLQWASAIGQADGVTEATALALDADGSVILGGIFGGDADFDPGPDDLVLVADGEYDMFVAKLTNLGELDWVNGFGTPGDSTVDNLKDRIADVTVDGGSFVYVAGNFVGPVDFDPGPTESILTAASGEDLFLMKLDRDGNLMGPATEVPEGSEQ